MRRIFRSSTFTGPSSTAVSTEEKDPVIGFGIPNTVEKLKKGPGFRFRERDRVKVVAPQDFAHKTGYIVESNDLQNEHGLMEIELDHELKDGEGYHTLNTKKYDRITIKKPTRQLTPYKYMKCQHQHFATTLRAESLLQMSTITTYMLCAEIISLFIAIKNGVSQWNSSPLFISYLICCSISMGLGFFIALILSFIGTSIKRISGEDNLIENGSIHDECKSHHWIKSTHWKPWWLCGHHDVSSIEFVCKHTANAMVAFIGTFMISIVLYLADHIEWYLVLICMLFIVIPSILAFHIIKNREMMSF